MNCVVVAFIGEGVGVVEGGGGDGFYCVGGRCYGGGGGGGCCVGGYGWMCGEGGGCGGG